jgi:hypothetical protein
MMLITQCPSRIHHRCPLLEHEGLVSLEEKLVESLIRDFVYLGSEKL